MIRSKASSSADQSYSAVRFPAPPRRAAVWRRKGDEWLLRTNRRTYASIVCDCDHYICFAVDAGGNSYDLGPARTLAEAKRYLAQRFAP